jgi:hypothetical protein
MEQTHQRWSAKVLDAELPMPRNMDGSEWPRVIIAENWNGYEWIARRWGWDGRMYSIRIGSSFKRKES